MKRPVLTLLGGAVIVLTATAGFAQSSSDGSREANKTSPALEEVVVTARKRSESLLEVPVIANVLTADALERQMTQSLYMVAQRVPALVLGDSLAANGVQVTMRGVGTTANNATIDQSVALNIDGVQLTQGLSYNIGMFDVGQVEVLKGPQALFFGKNSPAGVISLTSADPTDQAEASVSLGYESEAKQTVGELILSGPVSDALKLRLSARYSDMEGFFRNEAVPTPGLGGRDPLERDVAPTEDLVLRATALFEPNETYSARLKVNYEDLDITGPNPASQIVYCPDGTNGVAPLNIAFIGQDDCKLDKTIYLSWPDPAAFPGISNDGVPFFGYDQVLASLDQSFKLNDSWTLTSLTGYHELNEDYLFVASVISASTILMSDSAFETDQFTQEFRLASDYADSPWNYMVGAFYQKANQKTIVHLRGNTFFNFPATLQQVNHDIDIEAISLFGQAKWNINPELELSVGARWTDEERNDTQTNFNPGSGPVGPAPLLDPKVESDHIAPEVTLTYKPTGDLTLFAAYKTGHKSGSFNGVVYAPPTLPISFKDEEVKGGEVGLKARLMNQFSVSVAPYYYKYDNLQVGANEISGATGALQLRTLNAASANVYGVDFDATYAPERLEGLTFSTALAYNHARYDSFPNAPCGNGQTTPQGCDQVLNPATGRFTSQDLSGEPLVRAPEWSGYVGFDYQRSIGADMILDFGSFVNFSSDYSTNLINQPGFTQDSYSKINASFSLSSADEKWKVSLIGNNLNDEITVANCFNSNSQNGVFFGGQIQGGPLPGPAGTDESNCPSERGRELWVRVTTKFSGM